MHKLVKKAIFKSICTHHKNSRHPEELYKNGTLENFAKFIGKQLRQNFFSIEM